MQNIILLLIFLPFYSYADMSECVNIPVQDKKNMCMASYSGSSTFCEKIKNFENRTQCMRMVVSKQRIMQYSTVKPKEEKQGE
jgi:hypothetical protein